MRFTLLATVLAFGIATMTSLTNQSARGDERLFELRVYKAEPGRQSDLLKVIESTSLSYMAKHKIALEAAWVPVDSKDERVFTLVSHQDQKSAAASWEAFQADPDWKRDIEKAYGGSKPVKGLERVYLTVNDYSPNGVSPSRRPLVMLLSFELTLQRKNNLKALNNRFRNHTIKLFSKHGMSNLIYWSVPTERSSMSKNCWRILLRRELTRRW